MSNRPTSSDVENDGYEVPRGTEYEEPRGTDYEEPRETEYEGMHNTEAREQVYEGLKMEQPRVEPRKCQVSQKTKWCLGVASLLVLLCLVIAAMVTGFLLLHQTIDTKIAELKQQDDLLKKNMSEQISDSKNQLDLLQDQINKVRLLTAFHVYMDYGVIYKTRGDIIPFDKVITNIGGDFDTTTHKFRCPVSGLYAFFMTVFTGNLTSNDTRLTSSDLMRDTTILSRTWCQNKGSDHVGMMCSNQAVTECQSGSTVWVRCGYYNVTLFGTHSRETTFSGFLLKQN